jgi:hypothetical protein
MISNEDLDKKVLDQREKILHLCEPYDRYWSGTSYFISESHCLINFTHQDIDDLELRFEIKDDCLYYWILGHRTKTESGKININVGDNYFSKTFKHLFGVQ